MPKKTNTPEKNRIEIQSDIHTHIGELIQSKDVTLRENQDAIERRKTVHAFTNLRDTMTEEEKNEAGREEIVNFGSTMRAAQINIAPMESIIIGTDSLCDTTVDFNKPNTDHLLAVEIAAVANKWLFTSNEKFHHMWRTAVGEGYLAGGGPAMWDEQEAGLFPKYNNHVFFPKGSKLDPEEITFAYERREMSIHDLKAIIATVDDDDDGDYISKESIEDMIEEVKSQMSSRTNTHSTERVGIDLDNDNSARDNGMLNRTTFDVWVHWEVRCYDLDYKDKDKAGQKYVSKVMFVDGCTTAASRDKNGKLSGREESYDAQAVIIQEKVAFDDPREWLVMLIFDEEIGGEKTIDTLRGIAEAYYKPAVLIEELRNVEIEGALMVARPTLMAKEGADPDEVLDFQMGQDLFAPNNVEILQIPNTGNQVRPVVADLMQTVSGIASSGNSNTGRGQELRQQAIERQDNTTTIKNNRIIKAYMKIDQILDLIVGRALTLDPDAGTEDYRLIKGFQESLDEKIVSIFNLVEEETDDGIDTPASAMKKAAEIRERVGQRKYGKFKYLTVKASRNATGLDRPTEIDNASFILQMIETGRVPAQNVPVLLERAAAYQTQNVDIAALLTNKPEPISTEQQERAAAEFDTIRRRASAGVIQPVGPRDIDEDHIEAHTLDIIAFVNSNGLRPWDQLDVAEFAAVIQHIGGHIERMRQRPESAGVARQKMLELQEIVKQAGGIIQVLEEQKAAQENEELSPDDRLKLAKEQKTYAEIEMLGRKFGVELADKRDIMRGRVVKAQQNDERQTLMERQQLVSEINKDREFQLKKLQSQQKEQ